MARVMILGSGGREAAIDWWFREYGHESFVAPGNADSQRRGTAIDVKPSDFEGVAREYFDRKIDLVFVGPEAPLVQGDGIVDVLRAEGVNIFGPRKATAMLEGSKIFARRCGTEFDLPQPRYQIFNSGDHAKNVAAAAEHIQERKDSGLKPLLVIKSDHLAGGKGVGVCDTEEEVMEVLKAIGKYGPDFLLEERLVGTEASAISMCDFKGGSVGFPFARDYKQRLEGNKGPMTGGMGTYAPSEVITSDIAQKIRERVFEPMIKGMIERGTPIEGVLYAGLMIQDGEPYVLEFNVRFGDPETQSQLPLVDADPYLLMQAALAGNINAARFGHRDLHAVTVVAADKEYPTGSCAKDNEIRFGDVLGNLEGVHVFHAGTRYDGNVVRVSGGRVLGVTGVDTTHERARLKAYNALGLVHFEGMGYRRDIAEQ